MLYAPMDRATHPQAVLANLELSQGRVRANILALARSQKAALDRTASPPLSRDDRETRAERRAQGAQLVVRMLKSRCPAGSEAGKQSSDAGPAANGLGDDDGLPERYVGLIRETAALLAAYDAHAETASRAYRQALKTETGTARELWNGLGLTGGPSVRVEEGSVGAETLAGGGSGDIARRGDENGHAAGIAGESGVKPRIGGGQYDASRDPRMRR